MAGEENVKKSNDSNTASSSQISGRVISEDEAKRRYSEFQKMVFQAATQLQFVGNLNKDANITYTQYTKENYRTYVQNPRKNEKELRNMSQFLARVSMPYRRLLWYMASIYCFYWNLTPILDIDKLPDETKLNKAFMEMCKTIERMNLPLQMVNILYFVFRDGIFYGFLYEDDNSIFVHRLNPDYCKPVQIESGVLNFAFDFSYFAKYPEALETWDSSFQSMYNTYKNDTTNYRWQILDPEKTICIKADPDLDEILPFFIGTFEALLDLIDARTLQRNKDIIQNYKLILQKIPAFNETSAKELDDFKLEWDTIKQFAAQLADNVPEAVGVVTTPMDIDTVDFNPDDDSNDLVSSSMKQVFSDSGVSQLLFNSETTGSTGIDASIKSDAAVTWNLVKAIENWTKRFIKYRETSVSFEFEILDVNIFNKDAAVTRELSLANSGVPNKMKLAATSGMTPTEALSSMIWENQYLKIHENWVPLQTSYTMSSSEGRPSAEDDPTTPINDSTAKNKDSGDDDSNKIE